MIQSYCFDVEVDSKISNMYIYEIEGKAQNRKKNVK